MSNREKMSDALYYARYIIERDKKDIDLTWTWFVGKTKIEIEKEINTANPKQLKVTKADRTKISPLTIHSDASRNRVLSKNSGYGMREVSAVAPILRKKDVDKNG